MTVLIREDGWLVEVSMSEGEWIDTHMVFPTSEQANAYAQYAADTWRANLGITLRGTRVSHLPLRPTHTFCESQLAVIADRSKGD